MALFTNCFQTPFQAAKNLIFKVSLSKKITSSRDKNCVHLWLNRRQALMKHAIPYESDSVFSTLKKHFFKLSLDWSWIENVPKCINPLTPKIWKIILLTNDHTNRCWLFLRIWCHIKTLPPIDNFLNSHYLSALHCIKIVIRIDMFVTPESEGLRMRLPVKSYTERA